jgi:hypothetical protein
MRIAQKIWILVYSLYASFSVFCTAVPFGFGGAWTWEYPFLRAVHQYSSRLALFAVVVGSLVLFVGNIGLFMNRTWAKKTIGFGIYGILLSIITMVVGVFTTAFSGMVSLFEPGSIMALLFWIIGPTVIIWPGILTVKKLA